ncbi:signal transduction histidine kinase/ligand-binding sensor domain-containing protein/DNA-binding response OmpR family regulator [Pedobacter sp. W3I1]|uniref:hybrid sensor histidine kinase/response regulator transcription factor n=1 Tax=Pedobacter sp. W3I1 TaxID=3042291 RepID=UPI002783B65B|nr:hybrid sensor histidine kinase/response regulator transcription factor [Pedobacter sp. W3I1]MDQ0640523.1 signal transduction histidine kinase/ligand-binding sensor domain-containing protein/DNA-binding response OmpR family regulator [Pedobacter sp. W3I1]
MSRFLAFICALILYIPLSAQENVYQFSHLDIANGLSDNQVNAIYKDKRGFMWFGTMAGLNRYDGHEFKVFKHSSKDTSSIPNGYVVGIFEGPEQQLWIASNGSYSIYDPSTEKFERFQDKHFKKYKIPGGYLRAVRANSSGMLYFYVENQGIFRYDHKSGTTIKYTQNRGALNSLSGDQVSDFIDDEKGNLWVIYTNGIIKKFNLKLRRVTNTYLAINKRFGGQINSFNLNFDSEGNIYIYSRGNPFGLYYFNASNNTFAYFGKKQDHSGLSSNNVSQVIEGEDGKIWIGTDHGGINILDKHTNRLTYILNKEGDLRGLSDNSIGTLYKDNDGIVWVGTYKRGICYYHKSIYKFPLNQYLTGKNALNEDVNSFVEDNKGNLWIGTNGAGLLYLNRTTGQIKRYRNNPASSNSLSSDIVISLTIDHSGILWIGTYLGGLDCFDGKKFTNFKHSTEDPQSISDNRIYALLADAANRLWVGTLNGGLDWLDTRTGKFKHFNPSVKNTLNAYVVTCLYGDRNKNLWVGTTDGVSVLDGKTSRFRHLKNNSKDTNSLIQGVVNSITEDSRGWIWIGTREGISIYHPATGKFTNLIEDVGLPENTVLTLVEDEDRNIWYSSLKGLYKIAVIPAGKTYTFRYSKYNKWDGLQNTQFNINAVGKTRSSELIFGGPNGFNIFRAGQIKSSEFPSALVMTDLEVFYHKVSVGEKINGHIILPETITALKNLKLSYKENIFSVQFALLNYFNPKKIIYKYNLEGFDKRWLTVPSESRKATFTNLDPGNYTLHVRAFNENETSPLAETQLKITILPPFWRTIWAYIGYVLAFGCLLLFIRSRGINKLRREFALVQERIQARQLREQDRKEAERLRELDLLKIKFLTNLSHEFRTPISLILAPVDKLLTESKEKEGYGQLAMVKRNARRLLNLVNQLLDFRKMEEQELRLNNSEGEIISFIKDATDSFYDLAERKQINFTFETTVEKLYVSYDQDKVERILFNLLSNAFKFTPSGGKVSVTLQMLPHLEQDDRISLEIKVADSGIGIPEDKQEKIFERFFQNETSSSILNQGSGIGLSITKEFVKMQGGEITVQSKPGLGTCFIVHLNLTPVAFPGLEQKHPVEVEAELPNALQDKKEPVDKRQHIKNAPLVLLVEDNDDFRFYLKDNLGLFYNIVEASNGKEGWQKALALHPNLIVSDISMPEMNGKELCIKLKSDERTKHIPIILLTALTAEEEQLKGLETGANDYMTKPFNFEILHSKIKNLLTLHQTFKKTYSRQVSMSSPEMEIESDDVKFLNTALLYIEENLHNSQLSVEDLSSYMAMSRVSLYKKCLRVTGKTPVDFIRSVKLEKAAVLLEKSSKTISEICYMVGFSTPNYFAKAFKAQYHVLPSEYIAEKRNLH